MDQDIESIEDNDPIDENSPIEDIIVNVMLEDIGNDEQAVYKLENGERQEVIDKLQQISEMLKKRKQKEIKNLNDVLNKYGKHDD